MRFQEPSAEFVRIDMKDVIRTSTCDYESTKSTSPSGETCTGCDAPQNNCSGMMIPPGTVK